MTVFLILFSTADWQKNKTAVFGKFTVFPAMKDSLRALSIPVSVLLLLVCTVAVVFLIRLMLRMEYERRQ